MTSCCVGKLVVKVAISRCDTCPFWRRLNDDSLSGECHRRAPTALQTDGMLDFKGIFPETDFNCFCGDHPATVEFMEERHGKR